ncbi:MAG: hypothetical protein OEV41_11170, partial [Gammaproteobacteria bacterium]|nr:hypothetical protein [Gammaproteobacteria bacterium]
AVPIVAKKMTGNFVLSLSSPLAQACHVSSASQPAAVADLSMPTRPPAAFPAGLWKTGLRMTHQNHKQFSNRC